MLISTDEFISASVVWLDGIHSVSSPIVVCSG